MKKFSWDIFFIKITSRKLWLSVCSFVTLILTACGMENQVVQVTAIIMAGATVIGYLIANGLTNDVVDGGEDIDH